MKKSPGIRQVLALCALTALTIAAGAARAADPVKVKLGDLGEADEIFSRLMGDIVEPRREFIQANALAAGARVVRDAAQSLHQPAEPRSRH